MSKGKYLVNCPFKMETSLFISLARNLQRMQHVSQGDGLVESKEKRLYGEQVVLPRRAEPGCAGRKLAGGSMMDRYVREQVGGRIG